MSYDGYSSSKGRDKSHYKDYDYCIDEAKNARKTQRLDTDPRVEKEGFLGIDELDRMRRRKIGKLF